MKRAMIAGAVMLMAGMSSTACAEHRLYLEGNMGGGQSNIAIDAASETVAAHPSVFPGYTWIEGNRRTFGFKLMAGVEINRWFDVQVGYANLGKFRAKASGTSNLTASDQASAIFADAVLKYSFTDTWGVFLKAGAAQAKVKSNAKISSGSGVVLGENSESYSSSQPTLGIGFSFDNPDGQRGGVIEIESYLNMDGREKDANDTHSDVDFLSIGFRRYF